MKKLFRKTTWVLFAFMCVMSSCDKQELVEQPPQKPQDGDIAVGTEIVVDGENVTNTRAASEAGYTTGDGLYDKYDKVTVAAFANDGYELTAFYDKKYPSVNLGTSHVFIVEIPQTFKAEFARKYIISASASPSDGGKVTGGGKYKNGALCTLTATPNSGYTLDGWYEGSTKVSSNLSYSFTVSSNRTITAQFGKKTGKTFNFQLNGDGYLEGWNSLSSYISETITREQLGINREHYIFPHAADGWMLNGDDYWEVNGVKVVDYQAQSGELFLTPDVYDKYPDNSIFTYTLKPASTLEYAITVKATRWTGSKWNQDVQGSQVGFNENDLTTWEKTTKASAGEKLTVYAEGAAGFHSFPNDTDHWYYKVAGFYNVDHVPYKIGSTNNAGIDSYTFTVNGDRIIYVDFQYVSQ